jgi:hypothetical protein
LMWINNKTRRLVLLKFGYYHASAQSVECYIGLQ